MPRPQVVKKSDLVALVDKGITGRQEQANALTKLYRRPVTLAMIDRARKTHGMTGDTPPRYEWAIPWVILTEDDKTTELQYLRELAAFADGTRKEFALVNTAARWLRSLHRAGLDIRYEIGRPRYERWVTFPADKANWHVDMLMQRVRNAAKGQRSQGAGD